MIGRLLSPRSMAIITGMAGIELTRAAAINRFVTLLGEFGAQCGREDKDLLKNINGELPLHFLADELQ